MLGAERILSHRVNIERERRNSDVPFQATKQELSRHEAPIQPFVLHPEVEGSLDRNQREALNLLVSAATRIADLYVLQENNWVRFYPARLKRNELDREALENQDLTSPYTIVERDKEGKLVARHAHEVFAPMIKEKEVARRLRKAADWVGRGEHRDHQLQAYLRAKAHALETKDTTEADRRLKLAESFWLEREDEPIIDLVLGLYDTYTDKFKIKYSWQAWVGVLDEQLTKDSQWFMDTFLSWWSQETGKEAPRVKMRVDHTVIMTGQAGRYRWVGNSLPCQPKWREEMGSKFTIFEPQFEEKFRYRKLPVFRNFIDPEKIFGITDHWIRLTDLRKHQAHEIGHSLIPGREHKTRLQETNSWIRELNCELMALHGYRESFKQIRSASLRESEVAMAMTLAQSYLDYEDRDKKEDYHIASTVLVTYLLEKGSIRLEEGRFTWSDTPEVFEDIGDMLSDVQTVLIEGKAKDARRLKDMYYKPEIYKQLLVGGTYPQYTQDSTLSK